MTKNDEFFTIPREEVLTRLPEEIINFYSQAGYLDLTVGDLHISQGLVRNNGKIIDNIDRNEGREIVNKRGLQVPSVALTYKVIIPYLRMCTLENEGLKKVLNSLATNSEFLEDVVIQMGHRRMSKDETKFWQEIRKSPEESYALKLRIGDKETSTTLPCKIKGADKKFWDYEVNGSFNVEDLNSFGFPTVLREDGEFRYWGPNDFNRPIGKELYPYGGGPQGEAATVRCKTLDLLLTFRPRGDIQDNVGIRGVKVE